MCSDCKKRKYTRDGWYHGRHEKRQRYRCTVCKRRFRDNLGFEYRQVPRLYITLALMLSGMGMAAANIQMTLRHLGVEVHVDTITRILEHYSSVVEGYARTVKPPCVGDKWGCDEKYQKVRGRESYVVAVMDLATRFVLAWDISPTKEKYDAAPLLRAARDMAGRIPRLFITDGLERYHIAFKVFHMLKGPRSIHTRNIHIRNLICNTNKQERLNGGLADHFRYARGINKEGAVVKWPARLPAGLVHPVHCAVYGAARDPVYSEYAGDHDQKQPTGPHARFHAASIRRPSIKPDISMCLSGLMILGRPGLDLSYLTPSPCRCILDSQAYTVLTDWSRSRAIFRPLLPSLRHRQASSASTALALPPLLRSALRAALMSDVGVPSMNRFPAGVGSTFLSRFLVPAIGGTGDLPV